MTEAAAAARQEPEHLQIWAEALSQVLSQISGVPMPCAVLGEAPEKLTPASESDLWVVCACTGGLRGELSLRFPAAAVLRLAQIFMSEPAAPDASITPEHREAVVELVRQVAGLVATALKSRWGEVQVRIEAPAGSPSWTASSVAWLQAGEAPAITVLIEVHLSAALAAALRSEKTDTRAAAVAVSDPVVSNPQDNGSKVNLDLLMDIELSVTLCFGSRRLLLREVLDLSPGTVVNLDRQVEEPVDMLLDGRLVARGEVVVMDGNYGLRITEVAPGMGA
jgi:flagellar motor switch protein FliN